MKKIVLLIVIGISFALFTACTSEFYESDSISFDLKKLHSRLNYDGPLEVDVVLLTEEHYIFYSKDDRAKLELTMCNAVEEDILDEIYTNYNVYYNSEEKEVVSFYLAGGELVELNYSTSSCWFQIGGNISTVLDSENNKYITVNPKIVSETLLEYDNKKLTQKEIRGFYEQQALFEDDIENEKNEIVGFTFTYLNVDFELLFNEPSDLSNGEYEIVIKNV